MTKRKQQDEHGKSCTKCHEYKAYEEFYRLATTKDGRQSWCKKCAVRHTSETARVKRQARKEAMGEGFVELYQERKQEAMTRRAVAADPIVNDVVARIRHNYRVSYIEAARLAAVSNCECCGADITGPRRRHIDHDYQTGLVRGVLCPSCNTGIGKLGDTVDSLERALLYLRRATPYAQRA